MGSATGNDQLKVEAHVTAGKLRVMRRNNMQQRAGTIITLVETHAEAMKEYGFDMAMVEALRQALEEYKSVIDEQSQRRSELLAAHNQLVSAVKETDAVLKGELDPLMLLLKDEYRELYGQYKAARVIRDLGGRRGNRQEAVVVPEARQTEEVAQDA